MITIATEIATSAPHSGEKDNTLLPLPDGLGLSVEEVRALLAKVHETVIPKDDPALMYVTMLNAYLTEVDKLHARHQQAMTRLLADKTDGYVKGVQEATAALTQELSSASIDGLNKLFSGHVAQLHAFKHHMTWLAIIVGGSALLNILALCLRR